MTGRDGDDLDRAIQAVEDRAATVTMCQVPVTLASTGRPAVLHVPVDMTDVEIIELSAFLLIHMRPWIQQMLAKDSGLWTPD